MKYDIIYENGDERWLLEKANRVYSILVEFCKEFADEFHRKPLVDSITLGLDVWKLITMHPAYSGVCGDLRIYDLFIKIPSPDWSVNPNYIEINLS